MCGKGVGESLSYHQAKEGFIYNCFTWS